jgi:imidazolonepropionase
LSERRLFAARRLVTCDAARATVDDPLSTIDDGAFLIEDGAFVDVGTNNELALRYPNVPIEDLGALATPGLVDAHTHAPFTGSRHGEYALRMRGAGYEEIAKQGGGIVSSMRAIRASTREEIAGELASRRSRMAKLGVTTIECKSGYGLDEANETKQLEAVAEVAETRGPRLVPTYLALHALPPEANGDRDAFASKVEASWLPSIARAGLAKFVDAYVDRNAFTVEQARLVLRRARELGLGVRIHAGQFADVGAAELAAELGAASADHLEVLGPRGVEAMAKAGVRAVMLPVAAFSLRQAPPPIEALRAAQVPFVVASDSNPGTAPTESLPLAMALAVHSFGLSIEETILGATREAARSLGLGSTTGAILPGFRADFVAWDLPHEAAIVEPWGVSRALRTVVDGHDV